jgi:hypothetical protein
LLVVLSGKREQFFVDGFKDFDKVFFAGNGLFVQEGSRDCEKRGGKVGLGGAYWRLERSFASIAGG